MSEPHEDYSFEGKDKFDDLFTDRVLYDRGHLWLKKWEDVIEALTSMVGATKDNEPMYEGISALMLSSLVGSIAHEVTAATVGRYLAESKINDDPRDAFVNLMSFMRMLSRIAGKDSQRAFESAWELYIEKAKKDREEGDSDE